MNKSSSSSFAENVSKWESPSLGSNFDEKAPASKEEENLELKQGYDEGYAEGLLRAKSETDLRQETLQALIQGLSAPYADLNQEVLNELVNLSCAIARSLVKRELRTEPETIMALIRDAVSTLNSEGNEKIRLHLHPKDAAIVRNITQSDKDDDGQWQIIDDPLISPGDCKVSCKDSVIDGAISSRINLIITQYLGDDRTDRGDKQDD